MPSDNYKKLKKKLDDRHPVYAKYDRDTDADRRTLCPHVLGYQKENSDETQVTDERVLCYQLVGPATPTPEWRCFDLTKLTIVADESPDPDDWETPANYSPKWQNSMKKPKHHV